MLREALQSDDIFIMRKNGDVWGYVEAKKEDYGVLDPDGRINIKPLYPD